MESKIRCLFEDSEGDGIVTQQHGVGIPHTSPGAGNTADLDQSMPNIVQAAMSEKSGGAPDLELRRMGEDYRRAQDEIANLRDENRRLRDEGVRMRKSISNIGQQQASGGPSVVSAGLGTPQDVVAVLKADLTKPYTMIALIVAVLFGLILSNFL